MQQVLRSYDCRTRYSVHNCTDCRDAYRYWSCAIVFPRCATRTGPAPSSSSTGGLSNLTVWTQGTAVVDKGDGKGYVAVAAASLHIRPMCASLCEDVLRKCPYVLGFRCPPVINYGDTGQVREEMRHVLGSIAIARVCCTT